MISIEKVITIFNKLFHKSYNTVLISGAKEPFYKAANSKNESNRIFFRENIMSSAFHEIAHWCIAGENRRRLDDYGYWYRPDGRNDSEQIEFYSVEIKPQALEKLLSESAGINFNYSLDNLKLSSDKIEKETEIFKKNVLIEYDKYKVHCPKRAEELKREFTKHAK